MITLLLASAAALVLSPEGGHDHSPQLGKLSFESTCSKDAHALFERGLGWLHSFEYERAERSFIQAADADPHCGIAYWGAAMSNYHPLWAPPTKEELERGRTALEKARAAGAKSKREQDYIDAIAAFYRDSDRLDHKTRALAYSAAMERLHKSYPDDREASVFYALSLIAAGTMDADPEFAKEKEAAALLNRVLAENADHPGVAHYLIHSFDYPPLAELALPAARRYASIAPDSAHAQHMPSHIFTRLGLWDESIKSNRAAEAAALAYARSSGMKGAWDQALHAMDYLAYAYLQTGQDAEALKVFEQLKSIKKADPPSPTTAYAVGSIPARVLLERRRWSEAATFELPADLAGLPALATHKWAAAHVRFANAVGAARSGNAALAREQVARLSDIEQSLVVPPGTYDWKTQVAIERQIAEAWLAHAEGKKDDAIRLMRAAADLDDATEKHPVTPGAILPAREQLGELLLELGQPAEAQREFEASLKRAPKRLVGLYGAARSAKLAGDSTKAGRYYAEIAELTKNGDAGRTEIKEARASTAEVAAR
jgi:tetratricopeptide (TPR) repeat protein